MSEILIRNNQWMRSGFIAILGFYILSLGNPAWAGQEQQLVDKAEMTLQDLHQENAWFRDHAKDAKAIFIVPSLLRGAFILGGAGGSGVLMVKQSDGSWSSPGLLYHGVGQRRISDWGGCV